MTEPYSHPPEQTEEYTGAVIDNRYTVLSLIGKGGMGNVYLAEHTLLKKKVAIKILHLSQSLNKDTLERFKREAIAASNMGQSNIVDVTDFGYTESGNAYFVMEYIEGTSLADIIREKAPLPLYYAIATASQTAHALYVAHAKGIVHRDLKPENILITKKDEITPFVKIVDFGISKMLNTTGDMRERTITKMGAIFGTPEYMSPEQAGGRPVDGRSDIYALGVLIYEMMTGQVPFHDNNYMKILHKHQYDAPLPPSIIMSGIPAEIDAIVMKCLEKDPDSRYQTMLELLGDLKLVYAKYDGQKQLNLSFIFNATVVPYSSKQGMRAKKITNRDVVKMLNQGTMAGMDDDREILREARKLRRKKWMGGILLFLLVCAAAAGLIFREYRHVLASDTPLDEDIVVPDADIAEEIPDPPLKPPVAKKPAPVPRKTIKLKVTSDMKGVIVKDKETGRTLCKTPCRTRLPHKEGGIMILDFIKDDFNIKPMVIRLDRDMSVKIQLKNDDAQQKGDGL